MNRTTHNRYTDEELLELLRNFYRKFKRVPTAEDTRKIKDYTASSYTYQKRFGTWNNAIKKAGLVAHNQSGKRVILKNSRQRLLRRLFYWLAKYLVKQ